MWPWKNVNVDEELNDFRCKMEHLAAVESDNFTLVENEEKQPGKKRKKEVDSWFRRVKEKKAAHERIEDELKVKIPSNDLKNCIKRMTKDAEELIQQGKFPTGVVLDDPASKSLPLVATELVGQSCSENIASISRWLKEDDAYAIGIHGMGGVGKTTFIKHVHNKLLEDSDFKRNVYWVTASQECNVRKLQIDIGNAIGLNDISHLNDERRKARLCARFTDMGKFVLIVDDLWEDYQDEVIGVPLKSSRCKMILTTRSLDVCHRMKCRRIIRIEPLLGPDAMKLFSDTLKRAVLGELNQVAEEIVRECGGLPLALVTMGCCMRGIDDVQEWKNALLEMRVPGIRQDTMDDKVFRILKFSYTNLKDEKTQHCFLSCVLFLEDHKIVRDELVTLWRHAGLLDEAESEQDKVNRGHAILNKLVKSCLLEPVTNFSVKCVKMHDLIRDMAIIITQIGPRMMVKSGRKLAEVPETKLWCEDLLMVSLSNNHIMKIPNKFAPVTTKLKVLLLHNNLLTKIPKSFFLHMREIRFLDLSCTNIESLPNSVSKLENLRYLDLSCSQIERIPESVFKFKNLRELLLVGCRELTYIPPLAGLTNLEKLDLSRTYIERLPDSVSKLKNLREFLLNECWKLTDIPTLEGLTNLRELDLFRCFGLESTPRGLERLKGLEKLPYCPWNITDMAGFCRLLSSLPLLRCYSFLLTPLGNASNSTLKLKSYRDYERELWVSGANLGEDESPSQLSLDKLESLVIEQSEMKGSRRLGDAFPFLGKATNLKKLDVKECRGLEYIMPTPQPNTTSNSMWPPLDTLCVLELHGLPDLRKIVEVEYGGCSCFPRLQNIRICRCPKIKEVFPISGNHQLSLSNLYDIYVSECEGVEEIFQSNNSTPHFPNPVLHISMLILKDLPKLESIYKGVLILIDETEIWNCPKLNVLVGKKLGNKPPSGELMYGSMGKTVICDASLSTLATIKSENAKQWWDTLHHDDPKVASILTHLINIHNSTSQAKQDETNMVASSKNERDNDDDERREGSSRQHEDHLEATSNSDNMEDESDGCVASGKYEIEEEDDDKSKWGAFLSL